MRAALLTETGGVPVPGEFDRPRPAPDLEIVELEAAGMNPVDIATAAGAFDGNPQLPCVVGREGIGRTEDGRRVYFDSALPPFGSFAEYCRVASEDLIEIPEQIDAATAMPFGIAGLAAWLGLGWRGGLGDGETVLILGASSVVGQIAVQVAPRLGAGRIVAAARDEALLDRAGELGADALVRLGGDRETLVAELREAVGGGADLVLDLLWGEPMLAAVEALATHGRLVQVGNAAGLPREMPARPLRVRGISLLAHVNNLAPIPVRAEGFREMCEMSEAGELVVPVEEVPLELAGEAWKRQQEGPHTKLVIRP